MALNTVKNSSKKKIKKRLLFVDTLKWKSRKNMYCHFLIIVIHQH